MSSTSRVIAIVLLLLMARWAAQLWLGRLNRRHVLAHAGAVPEAFKGAMDEATYARSVQYTLARGQLDQIEGTWDLAVLLAVLFSGVLPWGFQACTRALGSSAWALAAFVLVTAIALSVPGLPLAWYDQFRLEERFGFNTTTQKLWWTDRLKGLLLGIGLGYPLLVLILKLVEWMGSGWWLWAWGALLGFQLLMVVLAPVAHPAAVQQVHPAARGRLARAVVEAGRAHPLSRPQHPVDGRQQTLATLECLLHGLRSLPEDRALRHVDHNNWPSPNWKRCWRTRSAISRRSTFPKCC